jgi:hypothetical protein
MITGQSRIGAGRMMLARELRPRTPAAQTGGDTSSAADLTEVLNTNAGGETDEQAEADPSPPAILTASTLPDPWSPSLNAPPAQPAMVLVPSSSQDNVGTYRLFYRISVDRTHAVISSSRFRTPYAFSSSPLCFPMLNLRPYQCPSLQTRDRSTVCPTASSQVTKRSRAHAIRSDLTHSLNDFNIAQSDRPEVPSRRELIPSVHSMLPTDSPPTSLARTIPSSRLVNPGPRAAST